MEYIENQLKNLHAPSTPIEMVNVKGYDFNEGVDYSRIFSSYATTGIQASALSEAISVIKNMINFKDECSCENKQECSYCTDGPKKCTIFLGLN